MHELEKKNASLLSEADKILYSHGLFEIVEKYGTPFITGSYALRLMLRRDLDIIIATDNITEKKFFLMGGEIAASFKPGRMEFLNEFVDRHPRLPLGLYYGFTTTIPGKAKEWNIDIWALDANQVNRYKSIISQLQADIDDKKRLLILRIKNESLGHPWFQKNFFSMDIYTTVIDGKVTTVEGFFEWVKDNRKIDISI